jgi:hypothetical protein
MNSRLSAICLLVIVQVVGAQQSDRFDFLLDDGAALDDLEQVCDMIVSQVADTAEYLGFGAVKKLDCSCEVDLEVLHMSCSFPETTCALFQGSAFCGTTEFTATYRLATLSDPAKLFSRACLWFDDTDLDPLCIEADHRDHSAPKLTDCRVYARRGDGTQDNCASCQVCGDKSIQFDCTTTDLDPSLSQQFFLPHLDTCVGAGLILDVDAAPGSYTHFLSSVSEKVATVRSIQYTTLEQPRIKQRNNRLFLRAETDGAID